MGLMTMNLRLRGNDESGLILRLISIHVKLIVIRLTISIRQQQLSILLSRSLTLLVYLVYVNLSR